MQTAVARRADVRVALHVCGNVRGTAVTLAHGILHAIAIPFAIPTLATSGKGQIGHDHVARIDAVDDLFPIDPIAMPMIRSFRSSRLRVAH